jgi:deoxyribonuclease IV
MGLAIAMPKIGLKLWSTNLHYLPAARELFRRQVFDYIELFVVPESTGTIPAWQELPIPYVLHAPHSAVGLNPANPDHREQNLQLVRQVHDFCMALSPAWVIFHPGVDGDLKEVLLQFRSFGDHYPRLYQKSVIENKPSQGLHGERCRGDSPAEIRQLCQSTGLGFCLDFTHAICYAHTAHLQWETLTRDFLLCDPVMFHVCDGYHAEQDAHQHLGAGELDLSTILGMLPPDGLVTLETPKDSKNDLKDFEKDVEVFRKYAAIPMDSKARLIS